MSKIVILGGGESGWGAAVLAQKKGFEVFLSDSGNISTKYKNLLNQYNINWEDGGHSECMILDADEVIKSPGIPNEAPIVAKLRSLGVPIISEIEFAGRYTNAKMLCITGSNGKTTTTSLIYHILKTAGYNVGLAGNIGRSLAFQVAEEHFDYYVIELSSFQLDNMYDFKADVAVLLNITPDHLDRYGNEMQNYVDAKMRILQNQTEDDAFVYWQDDPIISQELKKYGVKSHLCPFSEIKKNGTIGYLEDGQFEIEYPVQINMEQESLALQGKHNLYNSLAAGISANLVGVKGNIICQCLHDFKGVEHRLEKVATVDDVLYINDSKATNVDACYYALESVKTPVVLILGGKDKGNDYNEIKDLVREKCRAIVFLGADNSKLHNFFDGMGITISDTHSMPDCVAECHRLAQPGDTVLLSPCCASFDLFNNMAERGRMFKDLVHQLEKR
ncbi:MAG TPA: UDP-N-acetylmuramoyl-L-alanine--D-glutamate ligase [Prevotellaceae bacterium]|jgi:UDP-N-acetylmuramoylalanine--D-glutamate ligase|nr:UDP-N-acetylmuramoyl-L-alanine--D-glutamate ligase [Prevotellaceae bacterium]